MSEKEIEIEALPPIIEEAEVEPEEKPLPKKEKEKKKRKPMTAEHKAKVMAGLAKARAASALARAKRGQVKKIKKADEEAERDAIIRKDLLKKTQKSDEKDKRIEELEKKLASLTLQDVVKKPKVKKVKVIDTAEIIPDPEPPDNASLIAHRDEQPEQLEQPKHSVISHVQQAPVIDNASLIARRNEKKPVAVAAPAPEKVNQIKKAVYRGRGRRRG